MSDKYEELRRALLPRYGAAEARAIALLVLESGFGVSRTDVYADKVRHFSEAEMLQWQNIYDRLMAGEPVQYVLGKAYFCGQPFLVTPATLIPRPETEELVQLSLRLLSQSGKDGALRVLDGGTGSGCIAVTIARLLSQATVEAWDISAETLAVAAKNAQQHGVQVKFARRDLLAPPPHSHYDLIVSNPPYVTLSERRDMAEHVCAHEPALALFVPDDDALRYYHAIARLSRQCLTRGGLVAVEINQALGEATAEVFHNAGLGRVVVMQDSFGHDRFVTAWQQE